jgi:hypothetical protein
MEAAKSFEALVSYHIDRSWGTSVNIGSDYRVDDRGFAVRFPTGDGNSSILHRVQTGSGAHTASYPMGNGGSFLGDELVGAWSWPLTPF